MSNNQEKQEKREKIVQIKGYKKLVEQFPGKQINKLVSFKKACPLTINQKLIFSFLVYRARREGRPIFISIVKLAKLSGMTRKAVSKNLKSLELLKINGISAPLVLRKNDKWLFNFDIGESNIFTIYPDWFGYIDDARDSVCDLAYQYFIQPAKTSEKLSIVNSLVFTMGLLQPKLDTKKVSRFLHLSKYTVRATKRKLDSITITPELFLDKTIYKTRKKPKTKMTNDQFVQQFSKQESNLVQKMFDAKWTKNEISRMFEILKKHEPDSEQYLFLILTALAPSGKKSFDECMRANKKGNGFGLWKIRLGIAAD